MKSGIAIAVAMYLGAALPVGAEAVQRGIPHPLPAHPGNIFLASETVVVPVPPGETKIWRAVDYEGKTIAEGRAENGLVTLGKLPVGYYELPDEAQGKGRLISVGVLEPLRAPTPLDSPIGIDVAMAWSFPPDQWAAAANLCQLAGMNRVRDRLLWQEMEPKRGELAASNRYDGALKVQQDAGLQVLQVNHTSANWANPNAKRFPLDLRDAHDFYRELARRWRGEIVAFEPWNEAEISDFGGHTGSEMASLQKAAYLGLKAGNPELTACQNVFAIHRQTTLRNFNDNQAWAYFDTFNLHHYEPFAGLPKLYEDCRAVSAGRPMWVTECNVTVDWSGDEQLKEPDAENLRIQSERVARVYAESIYEGARAVFYFMLPHYTERKLQYGLLHPDLTPRPGYVALAAVGRLLAGARPLGRIEVPDKSAEGFLFRAKPDGRDADVLVIWSESDGGFELAKPPEACFDHLGRAVAVSGTALKLTRAPQFVLLAEDSRPALVPPPKTPPFLPGKPGTVVMQALMPEDAIVLVKSGYKLAPGKTNAVPIFLYNFGATPARGRLQVTAPKDWSVEFPKEVELAPGERKELTLNLATGKRWDMAARVGIKGEFGTAGESVLALRFFSPAE